jgi:threonyl-tRNA synthetase
MKVVLPDATELELPEGSTGLDAARAIGPKLAEQAVLLRSNGSVQDLRQPLEDGQQIQIVTTRDKDDPDALYVLRHSAAHLLAEAVMRLHPGVKIAIGPPIADGFYYDFEFLEGVTVSEHDFEMLEAKMRAHVKADEPFVREYISVDEAVERLTNDQQDYKFELIEDLVKAQDVTKV